MNSIIIDGQIMLKNTLKSTVSAFVFISCLFSHSSIHAMHDDEMLTSASVGRDRASVMERGNEIMKILSSIQFKNEKQEGRYDQIKAKRHNTTLSTQDKAFSRKFLGLCESQGIKEFEEYSKAIFAHSNRQTKYISSLKRSLMEESRNQSSLKKDMQVSFLILKSLMFVVVLFKTLLPSLVSHRSFHLRQIKNMQAVI